MLAMTDGPAVAPGEDIGRRDILNSGWTADNIRMMAGVFGV